MRTNEKLSANKTRKYLCHKETKIQNVCQISNIDIQHKNVAVILTCFVSDISTLRSNVPKNQEEIEGISFVSSKP